jgi:salicylate hydroxylase/6-hydroxynicotinate 3-monooxygenase
MPGQPRIAIIGAGMGGLTLAAGLARFGLAAEIYEQAPAFGVVGAGIQLTPNATRALDGLGLLQKLRDRGHAPPIGYNRVWNTGELTHAWPMGEAIERRFGMPDLSMHRADLHAELLSAVPAGSVRLGHVLVGIEREGGSYLLRFADGTSAPADAVIGADGLHSTVRRLLFGEQALVFTGKVTYRSILPRAGVRCETVEGRVKYWGPDRHIVSYLTTPDGGFVYFNAVTPDPDYRRASWSALGDRREMLEAFAGFHAHILAVLEAAENIGKWALADRDPMPSWGDEGIVLLGDACHPMPPYIAQGAATAIEDAVVLARCLAAMPEDVPAAFRCYVALRQPRTAQIQDTARRNTWMRGPTDADWVYGYDAWRCRLVPEAADSPA